MVILTVYEDAAYYDDGTAAGASAYVPKRRMRSELVPTLEALLHSRAKQRYVVA